VVAAVMKKIAIQLKISGDNIWQWWGEQAV
jgi:hypothetical protein